MKQTTTQRGTTMTVQPMTSTRVSSDTYEVVGTSRSCRLVRHTTSKGLGGGNTWDLMVDGEFLRSFDTKREALVYCQLHSEL